VTTVKYEGFIDWGSDPVSCGIYPIFPEAMRAVRAEARNAVAHGKTIRRAWLTKIQNGRVVDQAPVRVVG
jgi:hypothetical protein